MCVFVWGVIASFTYGLKTKYNICTQTYESNCRVCLLCERVDSSMPNKMRCFRCFAQELYSFLLYCFVLGTCKFVCVFFCLYNCVSCKTAAQTGKCHTRVPVHVVVRRDSRQVIEIPAHLSETVHLCFLYVCSGVFFRSICENNVKI